MLNIASAQTDLGDNAARTKTLEELIAKYPKSDAGRTRGSASACADRLALRRNRCATLTRISRPGFSGSRTLHAWRPDGFATRVIAWQRAHGRHDLPWQDTRDAYRIWLSEIMLQQTQVATVLPYYLRFVDEFPDVARARRRAARRVLELWSGLGYYRRAHHLHAARRRSCAARRRVSADATRWRRCPASAARPPRRSPHSPAASARAILDGNVKRVLARHRGVEAGPASQLSRPIVAHRRRFAAGRSRHRRVYARHDGSRRDDLQPHTATLRSLSRQRRLHRAARRAHRRIAGAAAAQDVAARAVTVLLLARDGQLLLERRPPLGIWSGLWSLPEMPVGTDVESFVATRFNAAVAAQVALTPVAHAFTHFHLTMHPLRTTVTQWPASMREPDIAWVDRDAALAWALPSPIRKLLKSLDPL